MFVIELNGELIYGNVIPKDQAAQDLYEKFMCYCKTSGGDLAASIQAAAAKGPELESAIKAAESRKQQLEDDLKSHQTDRSAAKDAKAEATAIRKKEKATYDKELADNQANLAATKKATDAIAQGMGSFLQTSAADTVRKFVSERQDMTESDRQDVLAFLSGQQQGEYAPASGEIVGILKTMADEMQKGQDELIATEEAAVKDFEALVAAKKEEIATLPGAIESMMTRVGEQGVEIATMKNDAEDTADYKDLVKSDSAAKEFCMNNFYNQIFENQGGDIPTEEIATLSGAIESKMTRVGELGVDIATMKNDAEDTAEALADDQKFEADLEKNWALGEVTDLRKRKEANYKDLAKSESAAKKLISNRMSKFYNPKLYKAPPKRQLSEGDQIFENQGGDIPTEEIATLSGAIESKMTRVGELGVEIATMKNDAEDTAEALAEDQKFVADLEMNCAEKSGIHGTEKKLRAQEAVALADTIKILNDDDEGHVQVSRILAVLDPLGCSYRATLWVRFRQQGPWLASAAASEHVQRCFGIISGLFAGWILIWLAPLRDSARTKRNEFKAEVEPRQPTQPAMQPGRTRRRICGPTAARRAGKARVRGPRQRRRKRGAGTDSHFRRIPRRPCAP